MHLTLNTKRDDQGSGQSDYTEMRKVVDSNFLRSERLRQYLAKRSNFAVITCHTTFEAYKGDTLISIHESMKILARYPKQVFILKNTNKVCGLRGRGSGLSRRMIDGVQTKDFPKWCQQLDEAKRGNVELQKQLLDIGQRASQYMDQLLAQAEIFRLLIQQVERTYTPAELKVLREDVPPTQALLLKLKDGIVDLATYFFERHPNVVTWSSKKEVRNTYIFRHAICCYLLILDWIEKRGLLPIEWAIFRKIGVI